MGAVTGTATIVFTDLAGSTRLRSSMGELAADGLRREHDGVLSRVVVAHRGRLVKSAGDGILAAFESASDGVAAAVAMQQAIHELGRRRRVELGLRVGLSTGDVSWEDGDCFGLPVVEAARLVSTADPGGILAAEVVAHLTRGRSGAEFGPADAMSLKGLEEAVRVCAVRWSPVRAGDGELVLPLVGRDRELRSLVEAWRAIGTGSGGLVLVSGEPGIGKTRLLDEAAALVTSAGGVVWRGAAYEGEGRAYGAFCEMLDGYVRVADPRLLARVLGSSAGLVARLAPALREVLSVDEPVGLSPELEQSRTVDAVVDFVADVAAVAPLMVVVDDAHWADVSTVGLLRSLVRRSANLPVLVIVAYRDVDLDRRHPLADVLAGWRRSTAVRRVGLGGLDENAVTELLVQLADGEQVPAGLVAAITSETDGNPFFVREVLLGLVEEGRIRQVDGRWVADPVAQLGIPEGVREAIGRRLSRLSRQANSLLAVASCVESGFVLGDVAAVAGLDDATALDVIDEALAAQIIRPSVGFDRYEFAHALIRHTLWAELNPSRQVRLHRAMAEQIEERTNHEPRPDEALALARHFHHSAAIPGAERGVPYALAAADHAAAQFAGAEERQAVEIALELLAPDDDRVAALHERAARAAIRGADLHNAIEHARTAVQLSNGPHRSCALAVELGRFAERVAGNGAWAFGHLVDGQRDALDPAGPVAVQLLGWEIAEAEFRDPDNPGIPVDSPQRDRMNRFAAALPADQRPTNYFRQSGAEWLADFGVAQTDVEVAMHFGGTGDRQAVVAALRRCIKHMTQAGLTGMAVIFHGFLGRQYLLLGELDLATETQARGEALLARVDPASNVAAQFAAVAVFRSQLVDADHAQTLRLLEPMIAASTRPDLRWVAAPLHCWRSALHAALGLHEQSMTELHADLAAVERACLGAPNYPLLVHCATWTSWLNRRADHVELLERHLHAKVIQPDLTDPESDGRWTAALLCALGGRDDQARRWFQLAHERTDERAAILLHPHICCDEAEMEARLGTAGDRDNGLRRLDEARRWVHRIGAPRLLTRIDELDTHLRAR